MEEQHSGNGEVMLFSYLFGVVAGLAISLILVTLVATTDVYLRQQRYDKMQQSLDAKTAQEKLEAEGYE